MLLPMIEQGLAETGARLALEEVLGGSYPLGPLVVAAQGDENGPAAVCRLSSGLGCC